MYVLNTTTFSRIAPFLDQYKSKCSLISNVVVSDDGLTVKIFTQSGLEVRLNQTGTKLGFYYSDGSAYRTSNSSEYVIGLGESILQVQDLGFVETFVQIDGQTTTEFFVGYYGIRDNTKELNRPQTGNMPYSDTVLKTSVFNKCAMVFDQLYIMNLKMYQLNLVNVQECLWNFMSNYTLQILEDINTGKQLKLFKHPVDCWMGDSWRTHVRAVIKDDNGIEN